MKKQEVNNKQEQEKSTAELLNEAVMELTTQADQLLDKAGEREGQITRFGKPEIAWDSSNLVLYRKDGDNGEPNQYEIGITVDRTGFFGQFGKFLRRKIALSWGGSDELSIEEFTRGKMRVESHPTFETEDERELYILNNVISCIGAQNEYLADEKRIDIAKGTARRAMSNLLEMPKTDK